MPETPKGFNLARAHSERLAQLRHADSCAAFITGQGRARSDETIHDACALQREMLHGDAVAGCCCALAELAEAGERTPLRTIPVGRCLSERDTSRPQVRQD